MASAGAQCDHVQHVSTQLPYAITAAAVSCISYVAAGLLVHFELPGLLALPFGLALMAGFLLWKKKAAHADTYWNERPSAAHTADGFLIAER